MKTPSSYFSSIIIVYSKHLELFKLLVVTESVPGYFSWIVSGTARIFTGSLPLMPFLNLDDMNIFTEL